MKQIDYKKASTYYFIGNIFNKGIAFITVPIFTRIMSTYDYGMVDTYNSWVAMLTMILGFALHTGIRLAYVDYRDKFKDFTATSMLFTILASSVISVIIIVVCHTLNIGTSIVLIVLCLVQSISSALITDFEYYLMMQYRYRLRTFFMILPNLLSSTLSILAILFIYKNEVYLGRVIPTASVNIVIALVVVVVFFNKCHVSLNKVYIKYGLAISVPLIVHGIALNILSQSDRVMITWLADASQTGIYSLIYNFSMIATVITTSLDGVWFPWFLSKLKERRLDDIRKITIDYVNLMTYAMVCLIFVAPEIVKLLASKEYWEGIVIIPPVVLSNYIVFIYTLYVQIEHYYKKTPYITFNTLIAAVSNLILNYMFIPKHGYVAAAYTTIASYFISFVLHSRYAKKLEPDLYPLEMFVRPLIHIMITSILFYVLTDYWYLRWGLMVAYFFTMLFRERNRIFEFFPGIKDILMKRC